jgi:hypothetical protein
VVFGIVVFGIVVFGIVVFGIVVFGIVVFGIVVFGVVVWWCGGKPQEPTFIALTVTEPIRLARAAQISVPFPITLTSASP